MFPRNCVPGVQARASHCVGWAPGPGGITVFRSRAVLLLLGLLLMLPAPAASAAAPTVQVVVDGRVVPFDQPPRNVGGRVLVPLRGVFERLGAFVQWEPRARTVIADRPGTQVVLVIGSPRAAVNGRPVTLDVPPLIIGGGSGATPAGVAPGHGGGVR